MEQKESPIATPVLPADYEAPRIETVLSAEELEREVFYAGFPLSGRPL